MCGILCVFNGHDVEVKQDILKHRGPDMSRAYKNNKVYMEFSRLAINDLSEAGMQPFIDGPRAFMCNGEMYNHELYTDTPDVSDCLTLFKLVRDVGAFEACKMIKGSEFAFVYYDGQHLFVARDPIGVRPLFYTFAGSSMAFASEMKALVQFDSDIYVFPPGHVYCTGTEHFGCFYTIYWTIPRAVTPKADLKSVLIECVRDRVKNTHRDIGFLLSGGLDSSLICSIACSLMTPSQRARVQTFTIGEHGSPDVVAAQQVADYLGTKHTHIPFNFKEAFKLVPKVIASIESYDTTTVRASVPMWILCKYISEHSNCKVILSGEGSDELLAGYKYFQNAPSIEALYYETIRRMQLIHQFDGLRADRCIAAHGLELRTPFLDPRFVEAAIVGTHPARKMVTLERMEKFVLRKSFEGYLPPDILWRRKDAFSDAVGYGWVKHTKQACEKMLSDVDFDICIMKSKNVNVPTTKEEAVYRTIFWNIFGGTRQDCVIHEIWRPKWTDVTDPSAQLIMSS